jgi:hypothetical protein
MDRARALRWGGALLLLGGAVAWWVSSEPAVDTEPDSAFEDPVAIDPQVARLVFARIDRHLGEPVPQGLDPGALDLLAGPALWICGYLRGETPHCARGDEEKVGASVDEALATLGTAVGHGYRYKLDFELDRREARWPADADKRGAGTFGMVVGEGFVLPSEFLERQLYYTDDEDEDPTYRRERVRDLLQERGGQVPSGDVPFSFVRLRTASWVRSPSGQPVRLWRVHPHEDVDPSVADDVLTRAVLAAEHLASTVQPDGRIRYRFAPGPARERRGQNLLRHAGSTYSLIQAYHRTRHEPWREAADRALGYLLSKTASDERTGPYGGGKGRYIVEGSHIKLGGAGLALVALSNWQAVTGGTEYSEQAREFATFLLSQQQQSGEFIYFANKMPGGEPRDDTSAYYPGEAVLGLVSWYELDPDPRWLETARRGADWLIDVRDKGKGPTRLDNDHWLMIALDRLHRLTLDPRYLEHSQRLSEAVRAQHARLQPQVKRYPDYRGGYYEPPRATPASTRAEGLVAVIELLDRNGVAHDLRPLLYETVQHTLRSQYLPATTWWMADPSKVIGGWAGGIVDTEMRNDYTQHALSALLGTERVVGQLAGEVDVPERLARDVIP